MDVFLNVEHLKEEIEFLKNTYNRRALLGAVKTFPNCFRVQEGNSNFSSQTYNENVKLLMAWVNAVCRFYSIKVNSSVYTSTNTQIFVVIPCAVVVLYRAEFFKYVVEVNGNYL